MIQILVSTVVASWSQCAFRLLHEAKRAYRFIRANGTEGMDKDFFRWSDKASADISAALNRAVREGGQLGGIEENLEMRCGSFEIQIEETGELFNWGDCTLRELEEKFSASDVLTDLRDPLNRIEQENSLVLRPLLSEDKAATRGPKKPPTIRKKKISKGHARVRS